MVPLRQNICVGTIASEKFASERLRRNVGVETCRKVCVGTFCVSHAKQIA